MRTESSARDGTLAAGLDEELFRAAWPWLVRLGRLLTGSRELGEDLA